MTTILINVGQCDDGSYVTKNSYSEFNSVTNTSCPEVVNDIKKLDISHNVMKHAINKYYEISENAKIKIKSIKGQRKLKLIFYCLFMAYDITDAPVDPNWLAAKIGLRRNNIEKALNEFTTTGITWINPERMVPFYVKGLNKKLAEQGLEYNEAFVIKEVKEIIRTCRDNTKEGHEWTQNTLAPHIAIASLYFYMNDIKRYNMAKITSSFEEVCYISWACIRRYHDQVSRYYNA